MLRSRIAALVLAAALPAGMVAFAGAASAAPAPPRSVTAATFVTDRPDSGNGGYWADDSMLRVITITLTGGTPGAYKFTAHLTDEGSFTTIKGALAPNQGGSYAGQAEKASVTGILNGSADFTFTASTLPSSSLVPLFENDHGNVPSDSTSTWYQLAFHAGTVFGGPGIGKWGWTYFTLTPGSGQWWADTSSNGYGDLTGDGQITG
jgi:hypothetical protein